MDDLLDLDWSKQSNASSGKQQSTQNNASRSNNGMSSYNFEALTRSMPTNGNTGRQQQQQQSIPSKNPTSNSSGSDAFSSLLGFNNAGTTNTNSTLSMAERLRQTQGSGIAQPTKMQIQSTLSAQKVSTAWDGLDDFMASSSINGKSSIQPTKISPTPSVITSSAKKNVEDDIWNFGEMSSTVSSKPKATPLQGQSQRNSPVPTTSTNTKKAVSKDPFDFSEFEDPADFQSSALGGLENDEQPIRKKNEEALFDHPSSRKSSSILNNNDFDEEDDSILGSLGRPARPLASAYREADEEPIEALPASSINRPSARKAGTSSPPPHIIGQVVEMGFSPQQARDALGRTASGQDVQAALELLLHGSQSQSTSESGTPRNQERVDDEERDRRFAMRLQKEEHARQSNRMRANDDSVLARSRARAGFDMDNEASRSSTPADWQKQADQLYAQASELGANVFSKANALWATAKTQAQRALDEHAGGSGAGSGQSSGRASPASGSDRARSRRWAVPSRDGGARKDWQGKPKWMLDAEAAEEETKETPENGRKGGSFKDDDGDAVKEAPPFFNRPSPQQSSTDSSSERKQPQRSQKSLWGDASGDDNVLKQERQSNILPSSQRQSPAQQPATSSHPAKSKPVAVSKRQRSLVQDSASAVQAASQHKQRGNELFKRGAYGEAEAAYSVALGALDANPTSIRRVVILNNRANARLKNGDAKGTLDDTLSVLRLIVVQEGEKSSPFLLFRPSQENPLPLPEYEDVNLRESYAKALLRRAQAEELLERWDPALSVWSLLEKYEREEGSGSNGVSNMRAAKEGRGRCDKMLKGGDLEQSNKPVSNPRVRAAAASAVAKAEVQVKERLRAENAAAAKEEATKDSLRDSIDNKILAWKTGKENNVRALLASLHDVVWPGLGWKKVGMHELVMDNQVKKVYMRAIGRLHPDKLTPKSNTIEERMLGGAVFSVLNDAWSAIQTK